MPRPALLLVPFLLAACESTDGTNRGDDGTEGTDTDVTGSDCHPNVPEEYCFLWITEEPCKRRNGSNGRRVYRLLEDGRAETDGTFTATERWFFFSGSRDTWDQDVVDTLTYAGALSTKYTGAQLNCEGCEEIYEVTRTVVEAPSRTPYATEVVFAFDNMNPNGGFQENNKMFVFYGRYGRDGSVRDLDTSYARGFYYPDSGTPGTFPANYEWGPFDIQGKCY